MTRLQQTEDQAMARVPERQYQMRVGGGWREAESGERFETVNPFTGQAWASVPEAGPADVDAAVRAANAALEGPWGRATGFERARLMRRLADVLDRDARELAVLESTDNGKLIRETEGQTRSLGEWLRYFAGVADKLQGEHPRAESRLPHLYPARAGGRGRSDRPVELTALAADVEACPALAAGCTMVVKPSEYTPVTALELARRAEEAGLPPGVLNVVTGRSAELGAALVAHPGIAHVAFTGSPGVGIKVAAGAATHLARTTLELGGKSAQVVFPDADLDAAASGVIAGIFAASGQTCVAGSRLVVHRDVHDELVSGVAECARAIALGDPLDPASEMGPLANEAQLATVSGFVSRAVGDGATVACGGQSAPLPGGLFYQPTVVTGVTQEMEVAQEEIFGPVLAVLKFDTEEEAVRIANSTRYGLRPASGPWTCVARTVSPTS